MKNMYFEYLGQFYGLGADPESYGTKDFSFWKALLQGATDHLEGMLTGEEKPTG
jgi:putative sterol carrier protein